MRDYFIAGPPILIQAPAGSAVARYFREHSLEYVNETLDPNGLAHRLTEIYGLGNDARARLRRTYLGVVERHHLASNIRPQLLGV